MACPLGSANVWVEKHRYDEAEKNYFVHLAKLLNGCPKKPNKISLEEIETKTDNKETSLGKNQTTQNTTAPPLTDTKKEKEKKNKRINNKTSTMKGGNGNTTTESQQTAVAAVGSPKKAVEVPIEDKDESSKAQTAAKAKKDRWRNRRKNNSRKDEENAEKTNGHTPNGTKAKGENNPHDEKKVNTGTNPCTLVSEIAKARQHIKNSLERMDGIAALAAASPGGDVLQRLAALESNASALQKTLSETQNHIKSLESRIAELTISKPSSQNGKAPAKAAVADDDDGVDLFASDSEEEDEASAKVREQRLAEYAAKKSKKPTLIAKSSLVLDIKPWDDETDLTVMEAEVRKIVSDGLLWGASKFVPVAFGIKKLSISCVVEDEKVSIDWLTEEIEKIEDFVQSVDVAAFNKI